MSAVVPFVHPRTHVREMCSGVGVGVGVGEGGGGTAGLHLRNSNALIQGEVYSPQHTPL